MAATFSACRAATIRDEAKDLKDLRTFITASLSADLMAEAASLLGLDDGTGCLVDMVDDTGRSGHDEM